MQPLLNKYKKVIVLKKRNDHVIATQSLQIKTKKL